MRIKLTLRPAEAQCRIPFNYQYPVSCAIYKIISSASKEYADWLHSKGYTDNRGKPHKLFVFSRLIVPTGKFKGEKNTMVIFDCPSVDFYISSPMLEDFINNFIIGLFDQRQIDIFNTKIAGHFKVELVETIPSPVFSTTMKFKLLSPILVSTMREHNNKLSQYYYRPDDEGLSEAVRNNLLQKFELINHSAPESADLQFKLDEKYILDKGGYNKITKLITINEFNKFGSIRVKSFLCPFTLSGNTQLIQTAYECGIGEKNSIGFGMIEKLKE